MKSTQKMRLLSLLIGLTVLLFAGCGGDDETPTGPTLRNDKLVPDFFNMESLSSGWLYQVWARKDNVWHAGPAFNLNANAEMVDAQGIRISDTIVFASLDLMTCDMFRLTLQQNVATAPSAAGLTFLEGARPAGLRIPQMTSPLKDTTSGGFVFYTYATPTNDITTDEMSGIWFTNAAQTSPGIDPLPILPDGWIYEGWAYRDGHYLSTGRFSENTGSDNNCRYYTCGAAGALDFPGEDFLINAPGSLEFPFDFSEGDTVIVSMEPEDGPNPGRPSLRWYFRLVEVDHDPAMTYTLNGYSREAWPKIIGSIVE